MRRSHRRRKSRPALHLLRAWATEAGRDCFSVAQAHDFQDVDYTDHEQLDTSHDTLRNAVVGLGGFEHLTSATAVGGAAQHYQGGK